MSSSFESILASREQLIQIEQGNYSKALAKKTSVKKTAKLGCEFCPADKQTEINKLFTKVRGRKLMVVWQNPNIDENESKKPLTGKPSEWFWKELKKAGLSREDCDVQYAVRCLPVNNDDSVRQPNNQEIRCCSKFTEKALTKSEAKIYILVGAIAARQVCGTEYRKDQRIFWSEKLKAKVYCIDHPASLMYAQGKVAARIAAFRESIAAAVAEVQGKKAPKRYGFLEEMDYKPILTAGSAKKEVRRIYKMAQKGIRCAMDLENFPIDGKDTALVLGTCNKTGRSRVFVLDHPLVKKINGKWHPLPRKVRNKIKNTVRWMLENTTIEKVFHHGSHDQPTLEKLLDCEVNSYTFDTEYAEYFADPNAKAYGLSSIVTRKFPKFVGYKVITLPEAIPHDLELPKKAAKLFEQPLVKQFDYLRKRNLLNYAQIPLKKMVLYNGADCDVTKRSEITTRKHVPKELLKVYIDCGFILDKMQKNGPMHDFKHSKKLLQYYPPKAEVLLEELQALSGKVNKGKIWRYKNKAKYEALDAVKRAKLDETYVDLNPSSPDHVRYIIFKKLKIEFPQELLRKKGSKINTQKTSLELMGRDHKFPRLLLQYRKVAKIVSQYLKGYRACARNNNGQMVTRWWLTGTATGRLSSGAGKEKEEDTKVVNLQNVHGDRNLKNMLVPQKNWRELYEALRDALRRVIEIKFPKDKDALEKYKEDVIKKATRSKLWKKLCRKIVKKFADFKVFLGYDFGQIEVRVMAQVSDDELLISDCLSSDIHSAVGHRMTGWAVHKIKKDKKTRTLTKNIHFGILFGLAEDGVYTFIKIKDPDNPITPELAAKYHRAYFKRYKGVQRYVDRIRAYVETHGYVKNIFEFKRVLIENNEFSFLDDDDDGEAGFGGAVKKGAYWANQALNTPIQGAAHQLMLMALSALKRKPKTYKVLGVPTMEVHDALYMLVKLKYLVKAFALGKKLLQDEPLKMVKKLFPHIKWKVPLEVEGECGLRLGDTVEAENDKKKIVSIEHLLAAMVVETYDAEDKLDRELKRAA